MSTIHAETNYAERTIRKLNDLSNACSVGTDPTELQELMLPIAELDQEKLSWTLFSEKPVHSGTYQLPYLDANGKPIAAFSRAFVLVDIYRDGTAIARHRTWKYDYHYDHQMPNVMTLDGKPVKSPAPMKNTMMVKFYLLGCNHDYQEQNDRAKEFGLSLFKMEHLHVCVKCGHHFVCDTSD